MLAVTQLASRHSETYLFLLTENINSSFKQQSNGADALLPSQIAGLTLSAAGDVSQQHWTKPGQ